MNNQQLWQAILGNLEVSISRGSFTTWFRNTSIIERGPDYILVGVPNVFSRNWISGKYHAEMLKVLKTMTPEIREIRYQVGYQGKPQPAGEIAGKSPVQRTPVSTAPPARGVPVSAITTTAPSLNQRYTFDTFIIGKNNELAHAASIAVAKNPGTQYNPLFIYGGVGLGKTHLMHAAGNQISANNPRARILYVTSEKFTNDYVNAIGNNKQRIEEFKRHYRGVDALLIDDIQFISGKEQTQEEFFHTFNELRDKGKQIIITADRLPRDIPAIEQRLISRFEWGMIADMQPPDLETRLAILQNKMSKKSVVIPQEILYFIAENIATNIRELEGALNRLMVYQQMENRTLTMESAQQILANMINAKKKTVTIKKIVMSVAEFYNITVEDILKQSRKKEYVKPRQIAMYVVRKELGSSFPTIGDFFGGRDHTTVMHGVEKISNLLSTTEALKQEVDLIQDKLYIT
jgi:chromosomal replication initiator protein